MAVYTKINNKQIKFIERKYNIGKIDKLFRYKKRYRKYQLPFKDKEK